MASATSVPAESGHIVLPPIITSERDRQFLHQLKQYIESELRSIDYNDQEQRYIVLKDAFDKIIDYVKAYKPLLTAIKAEYEDCIETIQQGQREAFFLMGKLNALATEPSTIHNYRKRADDLEIKLNIIAYDNERLQEELNALRNMRLEKEQKSQDVDKPKPKEVKRDKRHIPGLTLHQSTDIKFLTRELDKLERQLKELNISFKTRYTPVSIRDKLKEQLSKKVVLRDQLQEQTAILKQKRHKLKVAVEAAHAYIKIQPPHQTIGEAVVNALMRSGSQIMDKGMGDDLVLRTSPSKSFEDDDPAKEKEAEQMLEYIEKFNELLEDKRYEEAATHAANSPKGILRTPETLHRFMELRDQVTSSGRSPYLAYCDWLMATAPAYPNKPNESMSLECVKCALEENRLDLITHWLSQDRMTLSKLMGDMILDFCRVRPHLTNQCMALAQKVYTSVQAHVQAMVCMLRQKRLSQAVEYAQKMNLSYGECMAVLKAQPSDELALGFHETRVGQARLLPMGQIASILMANRQENIAVNFIATLYQQGAQEPGNVGTALRNYVFDDELTTMDQWFEITEACQQHGYSDVALDVLAAATVIMSIRGAMHHMERIEQQRIEEEKRRQEEEQKLKESKGKKKKRRRCLQQDNTDVQEDGDQNLMEAQRGAFSTGV